jgi:uncharacterized 2Fe-2S/4Fe-4S cluster protein (DUF4445 family)
MKHKQITVVTDFLFRPDKKTIMESLDCYEHSSAYGEMSRIYDKMTEIAARAIMAKAAYVLDEKLVGFNPSGANGCNQLIYCLLTIGNTLADESAACFQSGMYAEGLVLDAIANFALFDCSRQLYQKVVCEAQTAGLGLTRRLSPGEGDFDVTCQQSILEHFTAEGALGITMTGGCMLDPVKSLAYVYGTDVDLPINPVDHDCSTCGRPDCKLRKFHGREQTVSLTVVDGERRNTISAKTSQSIMTALSAQGLRVHSPCGGRGTCGKCRISLISGKTTQDGLVSDGIYLACRTYPLTDCKVDIRLSQETSYQTVTEFQASTLVPDSGFRIVGVDLAAADWRNGDSLTKLIHRQLGIEYSYSLKALRKLSLLKSEAKGESTQMKLLVDGNKLVDLLPPSAKRVFGLAIDIGTTTLILSLVDLLNGEVVQTHSLLNNQRRYGADVISRIQYSTGDNGTALHASICTDIINCIRGFDAQTRALIVHVAIAGNTTMLHFLLGLSAESLGCYPFQPVTVESQELNFAELFGDTSLDCLTTVLPAVSAFVGADIVAGMLQCGFATTTEIAMLIDIGTNGEIAIGNRNKILCLATAAGPAFEGANISCGTGSISGAIASFQMADGQPSYTTIDGGEPVGICGSGIIDIMAACVRERVVNATGKFDLDRCPNGTLPIAQTAQGDWIHFTQKDVRELQLAKAAMRAGTEVLLETYGCRYDEVGAVYLAGSFGSHVNIDSAIAIGLLPKELQTKVKTVGNSSLGGTIKYLLEQSSQQTIRDLLSVSTNLDLAADPRFNEQFIKQMMFPNLE